jgi:hypothetical protein
MKRQSFKNHIRYYTPHHFIYYPIIMTLLVFSVFFVFTSEDQLIWSFISAVFIALFFSCFYDASALCTDFTEPNCAS